MDIKVKGNKQFFLTNGDTEFISYRVSSNVIYPKGLNFVRWLQNDLLIGNIKDTEFHSMVASIRGCNYIEMPIIFNEKLGFNFTNPTIQELDIIKAVSNIYIWLEAFFDSPYSFDDSNLPSFYNDFIIDANYEEVQRDLYFLPKDFVIMDYEKEIEELMKMNLLCYARIESKNQVYENYFVPFTKLGYKKENFSPKGLKLYTSIMNWRHKCLNEFFNNR